MKEAESMAAPARTPNNRVSVVIPTHNRCQMTQRAIDSVLAQQDARALEVIVVNDGSTDGTETALRARYGDDSRVRVITTANQGASAARNTGFALARGELVCFLDSDDVWTTRTLASVVQVFALHPELVFVSVEGSTLPALGVEPVARVVAGNAPGWSHSGFAKAPLVTEPVRLDAAQCNTTLLHGDFFPAIIHGDLFSLSGLIVRRDMVVLSGLFTERFRYYNDWEFFARLCLRGHGGYLAYHGFQRDTGRDDQISRRRPATSMPRRHLYILHSLPRRFPERTASYASVLRGALVDAQYQMGSALTRSRHRRWARRYLSRCLQQHYKVGRSLLYFVMSMLSARS